MDQLQIFNIQHYSVHDGPGIRTTVFLKGCPLRCDWCCNPESQDMPPQLKHSMLRCRLCGNCRQACPQQAIRMDADKIVLDRAVCSDCVQKVCVEKCYHRALTLVGETKTIGHVFDVVVKDKPFYDNSAGGVTLSGGEPLMQADGVSRLLKMCKDNGISTAVETCGYASLAALEKVAEHTDLFLFDVKIADESKHIQFTGQSNAPILRNLKQLRQWGKNVIVRIPLIPGITDTPENIDSIVGLCNQLGIATVNIEPYHALGLQKYADFGMQARFDRMPSEQMHLNMQRIADKFSAAGILCEEA